MSGCERKEGSETASLTSGEEICETISSEFTNYKNEILTTVGTRAEDGGGAGKRQRHWQALREGPQGIQGEDGVHVQQTRITSFTVLSFGSIF